MGLVGAKDELFRWPHKYQFFIRDCGILYIPLARVSTTVPRFCLPDTKKGKRVSRFPFVSGFFRQPFFQQRTSPILAVITDSHIYKVAGTYEDVSRSSTGVHRV